LILRKVSKFDAISCQVVRLNAQNSISAPDPAGGAYSAPLDPLAVFEGTYFKREGGEKGEEVRQKRGEVRGKEGRKGEGPNPKYLPRTAPAGTTAKMKIQASKVIRQVPHIDFEMSYIFALNCTLHLPALR